MSNRTADPDAPLWQWAQEAITTRAERLLEPIEGVRLGEDIEAVHDMRVASRRLVAAMRVFRDAFPGQPFARLLRSARGVTTALGAVRDLDVLLDYYRRHEGDESAEGTRYLIARLTLQRDAARERMLAILDRWIGTCFPARLCRLLEEEAQAYQVGLHPVLIASHRGPVRFREAAPPVLRDRWAALLEYAPYVGDPEAVEELHTMRIKAKWLRYTIELFAPAYADALATPLARARKLQELLGDLHDADVRLDLLRETLAGPLAPEPLERMGSLRPDLAERGLHALLPGEERVREGCYRGFAKEWKKLERQDWRAHSEARFDNPDAAGGTG